MHHIRLAHASVVNCDVSNRLTVCLYNSMLVQMTELCMQLSGADEATGTYLLEACDGNLEMAIGMHMDGSGIPQERLSENHNADRLENSSEQAGPSTSAAYRYVRAL